MLTFLVTMMGIGKMPVYLKPASLVRQFASICIKLHVVA
jgi:hypothetical protein